jgi:hypothetical protein
MHLAIGKYYRHNALLRPRRQPAAQQCSQPSRRVSTTCMTTPEALMLSVRTAASLAALGGGVGTCRHATATVAVPARLSHLGLQLT